MRKFRALVVDDEHEVRKQAESAIDPALGIEVTTAGDLNEAIDAMASEFFHVAIVDLQLRSQSLVTVDGQTVLGLLRECRPACRRVLLTQHHDAYRSEIFQMLDPAGTVFDAAVDKEDFGRNFVQYIQLFAKRWLRAPIDVEPLGDVRERLLQKGVGGAAIGVSGKAIAMTEDEIDYLISSLFGQSQTDTDRDSSEIASVALEPLTGGKSRAAVFAARPADGSGAKGLHCVVKIGPRAEVEQESSNYRRYVRYRVSLRRRVEMLSYATGDTLGAVCYSFAGHSPDRVTDLQTLLDASDERGLELLGQVLGRQHNWQPDTDRDEDLAGFFHSAYGLHPPDVTSTIRAFATRRAAAFGARYEEGKLVFDGGTVLLPTSEVGAGHLRGPYVTSVIHGDLNASNVIVSDTGEMTFIDFRHTRRGPWCVDLAALQASVRLGSPSVDDIASRAAGDEGLERKLWHHNWSSGESWWPAQAQSEPPYWMRAAARLMEVAHHNGDLSRREHAATCLLYALRVFSAPSLGREARLRLLVWMSALCRTLDEE